MTEKRTTESDHTLSSPAAFDSSELKFQSAFIKSNTVLMHIFYVKSDIVIVFTYLRSGQLFQYTYYFIISHAE